MSNVSHLSIPSNTKNAPLGGTDTLMVFAMVWWILRCRSSECEQECSSRKTANKASRQRLVHLDILYSSCFASDNLWVFPGQVENMSILFDVSQVSRCSDAGKTCVCVEASVIEYDVLEPLYARQRLLHTAF